jgi:hypothetical protein
MKPTQFPLPSSKLGSSSLCASCSSATWSKRYKSGLLSSLFCADCLSTKGAYVITIRSRGTLQGMACLTVGLEEVRFDVNLWRMSLRVFVALITLYCENYYNRKIICTSYVRTSCTVQSSQSLTTCKNSRYTVLLSLPIIGLYTCCKPKNSANQVGVKGLERWAGKQEMDNMHSYPRNRAGKLSLQVGST